MTELPNGFFSQLISQDIPRYIPQPWQYSILIAAAFITRCVLHVLAARTSRALIPFGTWVTEFSPDSSFTPPGACTLRGGAHIWSSVVLVPCFEYPTKMSFAANTSSLRSSVSTRAVTTRSSKSFGNELTLVTHNTRGFSVWRPDPRGLARLKDHAARAERSETVRPAALAGLDTRVFFVIHFQP